MNTDYAQTYQHLQRHFNRLTRRAGRLLNGDMVLAMEFEEAYICLEEMRVVPFVTDSAVLVTHTMLQMGRLDAMVNERLGRN